MTIPLARVTLKQHRFEVGAATLIALGAGLWALLVEIQLRAIAIPAGCVATWVSNGISAGGPCFSALQDWTTTLDAGVITVMAYLPFAIGLLASVPIVARELESRTAQTAWSLNPSRVRWLLRQIWPILPLVGVALLFAAIATAAVEADRTIVGYSPVEDFGRYGLVIVPRAFGAFGVGLLVGALLGRTLPALVVGAFLVVILAIGVSSLQQVWLDSLTPTVLSSTLEGSGPTFVADGVATQVAFQTPDGRQISLDEARAIAHAAGAPQPEPGDSQDSPAGIWLDAHGYAELDLGVTREAALGWTFYDGLAYGLAGLAGIGMTLLAVNRRRPT